MSELERLVTKELWADVLDRLERDAPREAVQIWEESKDSVVGLLRGEIGDVAEYLADGDTRSAKASIAANMSLDEWKAWRRRTLDQIQGVARRRAAFLDKLEQLPERLARLVGNAIKAAL